jgi:hypothetical protein
MVDDPARQLLAEIDEEVQRKRASGELPADFERQLDLAFAELAPESAVEGDFAAIMDRLEASATVDTDASVESSRPGVAQLKRVVGKAIDWDLRHLASEVSRVNQRLVRALQLLDDRVQRLEQAASGHAAVLPPEVAALAARPLPGGPWAEVALASFAPATGRVLHAECRDGALLAALQAAGLDAYGVEPSPRFAVATEAAVDVRQESAGAHLRSLAPGSLGGVLLSGCADALPVADLVDLLDLLATRVGPRGRVMVLSAGPVPPEDASEVVAYDLAPGRPLFAETWAALLPARGWGEVVVHRASAADSEPYAITASR